MNDGQEVQENQEGEVKNDETKDTPPEAVAEAEEVTGIEVVNPAETEPTEEDRVAELEAQVKDFQNKFLRARADLENFRKRSEREKQDAVKRANRGLLTDLLDVNDNFERATTSITDEKDPFVVGVLMIRKQLQDTLTQNGLEEVEALERPFDPYLHEAFAYEPSAEYPENTVIQVFQKGYKHQGQLLRAAKVKVSAAPAEPVEEAAAGDAETTDETA
ncbi:nucleotide exchange factor GrpE [Acanthopleuribacter pedis]|uniref:Protein GrpE n=1 Tax=Acanthopleuribacter pedis TaxID=442870 RepID=A0A8J7QCE2_9BACT|nr:nucleotide exchange factor GrpE [Acanthopleuribacter pedis]MBO1318401.1 nucleotide exchange factor GrpE [Acanthopleuribacter pedis]